MAGSLLSNIVIDKDEMYCECGKKMVLTKHNTQTKILYMFGYIPVIRGTVSTSKGWFKAVSSNFPNEMDNFFMHENGI